MALVHVGPPQHHGVAVLKLVYSSLFSFRDSTHLYDILFYFRRKICLLYLPRELKSGSFVDRKGVRRRRWPTNLVSTNILKWAELRQCLWLAAEPQSL